MNFYRGKFDTFIFGIVFCSFALPSLILQFTCLNIDVLLCMGLFIISLTNLRLFWFPNLQNAIASLLCTLSSVLMYFFSVGLVADANNPIIGGERSVYLLVAGFIVSLLSSFIGSDRILG